MVEDLKTSALQLKFMVCSKIKNLLSSSKEFLPPELKMNSNLLSITLTSSPTIGNTTVGRSITCV